MRILLFTETALPKIGGQELVVDALAREYQRAGHEVCVLAQRPRRNIVVADEDLPYRVVRHRRFISSRYFLAWYRWALLRLHARWPFDVVHCHSVFPCGYLAALCQDQLPAPVVITSHGGDIREGNARLQKRGLAGRHRLAVQRADALVAISRFTAAGFARLGADPATIVEIPNGVDLAALAAARHSQAAPAAGATEERCLLFLGRLSRRKGVDLLLQAWALAGSALPDCQLIIAGDGPEQSACEALARQLNIERQVRFLGMVQGAEKFRWLERAECVVMPSRDWEAFPLVVLEAYAFGRPVIGTTIPGLADLVTPGETGWLVAPEAPPALAAALCAAANDPAETRRRGRVAAERAQAFDWPHVAKRYLQLFDECVHRRRRLPCAG